MTPIIDLMAISNAHFAKLRDFITLRLPPGFPVKIGERVGGTAGGSQAAPPPPRPPRGVAAGLAQAAVSSQRSPSSTCSTPASPSATCVAAMSP